MTVEISMGLPSRSLTLILSLSRLCARRDTGFFSVKGFVQKNPFLSHRPAVLAEEHEHSREVRLDHEVAREEEHELRGNTHRA